MVSQVVESKSQPSGKQGRGWRSLLRSRRGNGASEAFVCRLTEGGVEGVRIRRSRGRVSAEEVTLSGKEEQAALARDMGKQCSVVVMLPRSQYLVKALDVPTAPRGEAASMLALEVEALLPAEFGRAEVSCRRLSPRRENHDTYEVYISRSDLVMEHVSYLEGLGLRVDLVLPSTLAWAGAFDSSLQADILVTAPDAEAQLELASVDADGAMSVRTIERDPSGESPVLVRGLVECIRSVLVHRTSQSPLTIGWIGKECPTSSVDERVVFRDVTASSSELTGINLDHGLVNPLLAFLAAAWLDPGRAATLQAGNLLPRTKVLKRQREALYKRTAFAAAFTLLGIVLFYLAVQVMAVRSRSLSDEIARKTAVIRMQGESVGHALEQLRAVHKARATRNDFHDILYALYGATPEGVTYSSIVLNGEGRLQLQGQAESLALPFLLPERLEAQPVFQQVSLRDAGQVKREGGTITEFRIECSLIRSDRR